MMWHRRFLIWMAEYIESRYKRRTPAGDGWSTRLVKVASSLMWITSLRMPIKRELIWKDVFLAAFLIPELESKTASKKLAAIDCEIYLLVSLLSNFCHSGSVPYPKSFMIESQIWSTTKADSQALLAVSVLHWSMVFGLLISFRNLYQKKTSSNLLEKCNWGLLIYPA